MVLSLMHVVHSWKQYVSSLELLYVLALLVSELVCRHVLGATAKNGCMFCMVACVPPKYILDIRLKMIFSARHLGGTGGHFGMLCASRPFAPFFGRLRNHAVCGFPAVNGPATANNGLLRLKMIFSARHLGGTGGLPWLPCLSWLKSPKQSVVEAEMI
jgi:hypothetical protein